MANQPQNPQQPAKQAPAQGQAGKAGPDRPGTRPQDPADLGHDPKADDIQAGRMGREKSEH